MDFRHHTLNLKTSNLIEITDITSEVKSFKDEVGFQNGVLIVSSSHTTAGVVINERCEQLQEDMRDFFGRLAPANVDYRHNLVAVDGRPNAHSHLLSMLLPTQLSIVLADGQLQLGDWQAVFAVELDGPRPERKITLSLMGV